MIEFKSRLAFIMFFILRTKFKLNSPVFIGVFAPTRRGLGDLTNLSLSQFQITLERRIRLGDKLGFNQSR
jgi:hypothetical protein